MKRVSNLYSSCYDLSNIMDMSNKVCSRVRNKKKVYNFELYKSEHIVNIRNRLESKNINFGRYNVFLITDPKCRIVASQNLEDKIINHLIAEHILVKVFERRFTNSMVATRVGKGSSYGIKLLKKYLNEIKGSNFYVLKLDIKKYFYNIDHEILKNILISNIKDNDALNVLFEIIDSTNDEYLNIEINRLKDSRRKYLEKNNNYQLIDELIDIPIYKYGKGLPIGDQTSQAFGLIYLNRFNHFLKEKLHLKYVVNYMDDFVILHKSKEYLKYCLNLIILELSKLKLELNLNKTRIDSIKTGFDFLGFRFYTINNKVVMRLRNSTKKKFKKVVKYLDKNSLSSYRGHFMKGNCNRLWFKYVREVL